MIVCCVRVGAKYPIEYVKKLASMVRRHTPHDIKYRFVCLTDDLTPIDGVELIDISKYKTLTGWWAKMLIFNTDLLGNDEKLYFDLDTVIVGDLSPLFNCQHYMSLAICENFTKLAGNKDWPCNYGSCVMRLHPGCGYDIWREFFLHHQAYMVENPKGDQQAIEEIYPSADYLQDILPAGFFVGRRDFTNEIPKGASVMIFAGNTKPHNTQLAWIRENWK